MSVVLLHATPEEAFPFADPGAKPFGERVLVQLRSPKRRTSGGIHVPESARDHEKWVTTIGKVIAIGPLAFRDRNNIEKIWPEGIWAQPGDYVRCPQHGGDRWDITIDKDKDIVARFVIYRDKELIAGITGDPLSFVDYL